MNFTQTCLCEPCYNAFTGSGTGQETCKQYRSECHGASKFHGVRCKDKLCQCDVEDACDKYYTMSVYGKYKMSFYGKYNMSVYGKYSITGG